MRPNSIRARMTVDFTLFIACLMLAVCAAFFAYTKRSDRQRADATLAQAAQEIRQDLARGEHNLRDISRLDPQESQEFRSRNLAILVVDAHGRVIGQSPPPVPAWPLRDDAWRTLVMTIGSHTVVVALPWRKVEYDLRERALLLLALSTLVVAASAVGAWVLVGRTLSPIDHLARQAQAASTESLRVRLDSPSRDAEITRLVETLNDLLARLEQTASARERFYAAASHELRTPLQALTGHLEVALSRKRCADEYEAALHEGHIQAERLTSLVQDLLLLNQLDAHTVRPLGVQLDLADICVGELAHLRPIAEARALNVELSLPGSCELVAPWNHATMLIRNLLENAVKYATHGGTVRLQLDQSTLSVFNECEPIDGWEEDKYFEPFFRPDASRNSQTGGNGLGLAICKAICQNNGWTIALRQQKGGVCATVDFS